MPRVALACLLVFLSACATANEGKLMWRVRDLVVVPSPVINLQGPNEQTFATVSTRTMRELFLAYFKITREAGVRPELVIIDGKSPNAFMAIINQRYTLAINVAMVNLVGDDMNEYAALLGHEVAHLTKGHIEASRTRRATLQGVGTLIGAGMAMGGIPGGGLLAGIGADIIDASYSRDQEREADAVGIGYAMSAGFDPEGAVRLQEKLLKLSGGSPLPFLNSHPTGTERIENIKALIKEKQGVQTNNPPAPAGPG